MKIANNVNYGLTAGFYGSLKEADWFFENIEAGTTYANRPQGATTGAWPGFQPFGGWKRFRLKRQERRRILLCSNSICTNRSARSSNMLLGRNGGIPEEESCSEKKLHPKKQ